MGIGKHRTSLDQTGDIMVTICIQLDLLALRFGAREMNKYLPLRVWQMLHFRNCRDESCRSL